jgi:hypothetical protein
MHGSAPMLGNPVLKVVGVPDLERIIDTTQHVHPERHGLPAEDSGSSFDKLRTNGTM